MPDSKLPSADDLASSIEWARLRFERQKLALELRAKRRELDAKRGRDAWKDVLINPLLVAIVGGTLTLMTTVVTNYLTAAANRELERSRAELSRDSARQALQADLIKKFVEGPRRETVRDNLRFLVDAGLIPDYAGAISKYLIANPGSAPQIGAGLQFSPQGEPVSENLQQRLNETVGRFRTFLRSKGFSSLDDHISVFVYSSNAPITIPNFPVSSDEPNSFYHENTIYIHQDLSEDLSIAFREFSHYALMQVVGKQLFRQTAVESALADYLPATFLRSPVVGSSFVRMQGPFASRFRNLAGQRTYDAEGTRGPGGWFARGIVWAEALWACRDPERTDGMDNIVLDVWRRANVQPLDNDLIEARFGAALAAISDPEGTCLREQIARRHLPIQR